MKKIIAFLVGTVAVVATAIGVQAVATTADDDGKQPPAATATERSTSGTDGATKEEDGEREGFTEDHAGKPGENK